MAVKIKIPKYLQEKAAGATVAEVEGHNLGECIGALVHRYPGLKGQILDGQGVILLKWMVYVNNRSVTPTSQLSRTVQDNDIVELFPLVDGG